MNFSFANGFLLWGTLLFTVPLIIHLLNRRRYRVIRWAAQAFLLQAYQRSRRRLTLESLLLLLLRCLLIILLALALARPFVPSSSLLAAFSPSKRHVVLVIDTSYSMGRVLNNGESLLERAKNQATRVLDGLSEERGDEVTVVALADPPRSVQAITSSISQARDAISRMAPDWKGADLVRTLDYLVENSLGAGHAEVFVFSDLQRETFNPGERAPESDGARDPQATPASAWRVAAEHDAKFYLVDVGTQNAVLNLAVEDLSTRPKNVIAGEVVTFSATIRNHTNLDLKGLTGSFVIDGEHERGKPVTLDVPAGGAASVEFSTVFRVNDSNWKNHTVQFELTDDELSADNWRYLAFPVYQAVRVLLVDGDYNQPEELRETTVLADMLNPGLDPETGGSIYQLQVVDDRRFNLRSENLTDYDLIVLANVARIDPDVARELDDAVRAGRGLMIFLGELVDPRSYNERLYRADGEGLLPARLLDVKGALREDSDLAFHPVVNDFFHPMLRLFGDPLLQPNLGSIPVRRFYRTETSANDRSTTVIMRLDDDPSDPGALILEKPAGRGRTVLITTTADGFWAGFARLDNVISYLPLLQETASYLTLPDLSLFDLKVGEQIRRTTRSIPNEVFITRPDNTRDEITDTPREMEYGEFVLPTYGETSEPGLYALELAYPLSGAGNDAGRREVEHFAVNVDVAESDLTRVERPAFRTLYPGLALEFLTEIDMAPAQSGVAREGELWRALLIALIGLLAAELLLAYWFGRRFRGGSA